MEDSMEIPLKTRNKTTIWPVHHTPRRIPKTERDTYIPLFIAAVFTIARSWKQPRCPSTNEWIKKLWYIYTMEGYSGLKRNAFESVLMRWTSSVQYSSVGQSCLTVCEPMNHSMPGLPVHHQHPEFTQTHIHWVSDAIQPSHPLSSPSHPSLNLSQHQGLFKWVGSLHQVA